MDKFNSLFGLNEPEGMQDWEIECADSKRVKGFIDAYEKHAISDDDVWVKIKKILVDDIELHKAHIKH